MLFFAITIVKIKGASDARHHESPAAGLSQQAR
jgi:hypothetical protein